MQLNQPLGVYGKLPHYGDFIHRNLPSSFMNTWDNWLQTFVASSQEKIGENWLDIYLTSPIWRYVLSAGVIDQNNWAGIVLPSVDQVGRYYPFSIAIPLPANINPCEFVASNTPWFEYIEELALQALDGQIDLEQLVENSEHEKLMIPMAYSKSGQPSEISSLQVNLQFQEETPMNTYSHLLDSLLVQTVQSYSVWSTIGSENIAPCLFTSQGLPTAERVCAMIDGQWAHWGWSQPYINNQSLSNEV